MPARVLLLTTDSKICGTERMILSLLRHIDRDRYTPFLVSLKGPGDLIDEAESLGVDGVNLTIKRGTLLSGLGRWRRAVSAFRPDVFHSFLHHTNLLARLTREFYWDVPVISSIRTVYTAEDYGRLYGWLEWLTHPWDRFFAANSECGRRSLTQKMWLPEKKLAVVHNGLETVEWNESQQAIRDAVRREFGFSQQDLVIGIVAQLRPPKRHDLLIRSAARLKGIHPNIRLLIVGQGEIESSLKDLAEKESVSSETVFTGYRTDARRLLLGMDIFALPSDVEGEPVSVMEAMDASLPVAATTAGGIPEVVNDGETGLLSETGDLDAFTENLSKMLESPERRQVMGEAGRKRVWEEFSAERMIRCFEELYDHCLK